MAVTNLFSSFYHKSYLCIILTGLKQNKNKFALLGMTRKESKILKNNEINNIGITEFQQKYFFYSKELRL